MLSKFKRLVSPLWILVVSGCASSVITSVDGRSVIGKAEFPNCVTERGSAPDEAAMSIGGRLFLVSSEHIKWPVDGRLDVPAAWHSIDLPASWNQLQLKQGAEGVVVVVDGHTLTTIHHAA
jgi:hypothetical protein